MSGHEVPPVDPLTPREIAMLCDHGWVDAADSLMRVVTAARWFAGNVLPALAAQRGAAETTDLSLMELDEKAF